MAGDKGQSYCNDVLNYATGNAHGFTTGTKSGTFYLRLFSNSAADPSSTSALTEFAGNGYAAIPLVNTGYSAGTNTQFSVAAGGSTTNSAGVAQWTASGGNLGGAAGGPSSWAICEGATGAQDIWYWGDGLSAGAIADGNTYELTITITED